MDVLSVGGGKGIRGKQSVVRSFADDVDETYENLHLDVGE
jgi:hypothetical protein